jgi:hypothetical protein
VVSSYHTKLDDHDESSGDSETHTSSLGADSDSADCQSALESEQKMDADTEITGFFFPRVAADSEISLPVSAQRLHDDIVTNLYPQAAFLLLL